ncbi:MAG: hypothetical protein IPK08_07995 [Bacteroidetes bacterium]|nr:hypothetical protein [Bacteroidota bacterium]
MSQFCGINYSSALLDIPCCWIINNFQDAGANTWNRYQENRSMEQRWLGDEKFKFVKPSIQENMRAGYELSG